MFAGEPDAGNLEVRFDEGEWQARVQRPCHALLYRLPVGLLLNFGHATLKEGPHRVVNHLNPSASRQLRVNQAAVSPG